MVIVEKSEHSGLLPDTIILVCYLKSYWVIVLERQSNRENRERQSNRENRAERMYFSSSWVQINDRSVLLREVNAVDCCFY